MIEAKKTVRIAIVLFAISIAYLALVSRLFYWQVARGEDLRKLGEQQSSESLQIQAQRGQIMSSDEFPLATNNITYLVYANPKLIKEKTAYSRILSPILGVDEASISAQLGKDLFWVRLALKVPEKKKQEIEKLKLNGIGLQQQSERYYPEASMAAHLLGFVGKDDVGNDKGYFGIEGYLNEQLKGRDGKLYVVKDALGNPVINDIREERKIDGRNIVLSIDRTAQFIAENEIKKSVERYEADSGSVIIMEPKTGRVLATASYPKFDPQTFWEHDASTYKNPVISNLYEPGSTFKVLVMAAAIEEGLVRPDTRCDICAGPVQIGEYKIKTWNNKYYKNSTMTDVIQHSDNTGMVFISRKLGLDRMVEYLNRFGLNETTGIDLQGEISGTVRDKEEWYEIDVATASFGQGISITAMQLLTAVNAIANGGNLMVPKVVSKIITEDDTAVEIEPELKRKVLSETTTKVMTWVMVNAVEKGESKWTKLSGYRVAGKTGTAQIPVAGHYDPNQTIASFVGFFPAENPEITMLVTINKPKTSIYGSETAAPTFFNIARSLINYYNIPPSY